MTKAELADTLARQGVEKQSAGDLRGAEELFRRALSVVPDHPAGLHLLGMLAWEAGNLTAGLPLLERSVRLCPGVAGFHNNLGNAYRAAGRPGSAAEAYKRALQLDPTLTASRVNLGVVWWETGRLDDALAQLDQALREDERLSEAHLARGNICKDLGRLDEALAAFIRVADLGHDTAKKVARSNWLYTLNFHPACPPGEIFRAHRAWAAEHAEPLTAAAAAHPVAGPNPPRLKVGYVSACFRDHAVNFFVEPVLRNHDRERFEITCYSDSAVSDAVTVSLSKAVEHWRPVFALSDEQLARQVRADGIDIFVDLGGHMGMPRLLAFARRPAPVQVSYLGYQATTGLSAMDYRLTDAHADPPGQTEAWHTETLVRLPEAFFCYQPPAEAPAVVEPPCLRSREVTFGSFNLCAKVTPETLAAWAEILRRVPGSRLQLLVPESASLRQRVTDLLAGQEIDARRLVFVPRAPRREYLRRFQTVDIALDPFPFNSHTTSCDALWMGVPTVMLAGRSYVQRYGGSALVCLGLEALIATTREAYVETAVAWAADPARLAELRRTLRERMRVSAICDAAGFTRKLEAAYEQMWQARGSRNEEALARTDGSS